MKILSLKKAEENTELFFKAHDFLLGFEKKYCALMERVLNKESSVYVFVESELFGKNRTVKGVFSFNKGRSFTCCIPRFTKKIEKYLVDFFKSHEVFSIIGERTTGKKIEELIFMANRVWPQEVRDMLLMECTEPSVSNVKESVTKIVKCSPSDADKLFEMQKLFAKEEVIPKWKEILPAAERYTLEQLLKNQTVMAVECDGTLVAKAHTNAVTENYIQLGGVYTMKEYRKRGFACALVKAFALAARVDKKNAVLFVREKNTSAIHSYEKAGFKSFAKYRMVYYM